MRRPPFQIFLEIEIEDNGGERQPTGFPFFRGKTPTWNLSKSAFLKKPLFISLL
jgi:hypothetical protein